MRKRIVLDANIYVSALIKPTSCPGEVLKYILINRNSELVLTEAILGELKRVIFYPKVRKYIKKSDQDINTWLDALKVHAFLLTERFSYETIVEEDPDDDKYVIAALESRAAYLVSGDKHLLNLRSYAQIKIVTANEYRNLYSHEVTVSTKYPI